MHQGFHLPQLPPKAHPTHRPPFQVPSFPAFLPFISLYSCIVVYCSFACLPPSAIPSFLHSFQSCRLVLLICLVSFLHFPLFSFVSIVFFFCLPFVRYSFLSPFVSILSVRFAYLFSLFPSFPFVSIVFFFCLPFVRFYFLTSFLPLFVSILLVWLTWLFSFILPSFLIFPCIFRLPLFCFSFLHSF